MAKHERKFGLPSRCYHTNDSGYRFCILLRTHGKETQAIYTPGIRNANLTKHPRPFA